MQYPFKSQSLHSTFSSHVCESNSNLRSSLTPCHISPIRKSVFPPVATHVETLEKEIRKVKELLSYYTDARVSVCEKLDYCGKICKGGNHNKHIYYDGEIYPCVATCFLDQAGE